MTWLDAEKSSTLTNADVKIPFFPCIKTVQAYSDTFFHWRGFKIPEPSVCCHLLLPWKWICQVSWKQVSNKPALWKIMHNCHWCGHPPIMGHLPPRNSQLVPTSVGKEFFSIRKENAVCAYLPLALGLRSTCSHFASHPHAQPCGLLTTVHPEITHEHISYSQLHRQRPGRCLQLLTRGEGDILPLPERESAARLARGQAKSAVQWGTSYFYCEQPGHRPVGRFCWEESSSLPPAMFLSPQSLITK